MTRAPAPFPLERLADIPERPEDFRLLERIPLTREPQTWPLELSPLVGDEQPMVILIQRQPDCLPMMSPLLSLVWLRCFTAHQLSGLCRLLM